MTSTVTRVEWFDDDVQRLVALQQAELDERYGVPDVDDGVSAGGLQAAVVVRVDGEAVATGALRDPTPAFGTGVGEIKRMFVQRSHRRQGLSRLVLHELEAIALERGLQRLVLETGVLQPEAIALYLSEGYEPIDNYPPYGDDEHSRCFAKTL
jgi:GNAT superfamily N-acetyltransferase